MSDFRLEDLVAIVSGLVVVAASLFSTMALIALWPKIRSALSLLFRVGAWRMVPSLSTLADDLKERTLRRRRVKAFRAATMIGRARAGLKRQHYVETAVRTRGTEERTERTDERSRHDQMWEEFLLDRSRERLIALLVEEDFTVSEIRGLLKGESAAIGQEIEAAKKELGKAPSQPYRTPIAQRETDARYYHDDPKLQYQPPPN